MKFCTIIKLHLIPVLIFSLLLLGCDSVKTEYMDADKIPVEKDREFQGGVVKLDGIFLKDGSFIYVKDRNPELVINGKTKEIHYDLSETERGNISIDKIASVKVDIVHGSIFTPFIIIGVIALLAVIGFIYALTSGHFNVTG